MRQLFTIVSRILGFISFFLRGREVNILVSIKHGDCGLVRSNYTHM